MQVDVRRLDELINLIGELVLERNRLVQLAKEVASDTHAVDSPLTHSAARLSFITEELQAVGLRTRMVPIDAVFSRFPRLVRDLALSLNKEVDLIIRGQETEIDKTMVELIADPLVHLIAIRSTTEWNYLTNPSVATKPAGGQSAWKPSRRATASSSVSQTMAQALIRQESSQKS
jgi:hypothetical protein